MSEYKALKQFLEYRQVEAEKDIDSEKIYGRKAWTYYGDNSGFKSYEMDFARLMEKNFNFTKWARERKKMGKDVNILDLMGPGEFMYNLSVVDHILGITLVDLRDMWQKTAKNQDIIEGNINSGKIWRNIDQYLDKKQIKGGFNLIVCRPMGPFMRSAATLESYLAVYGILLRRAYKLLSSDDGLLLTQIPLLSGLRERSVSQKVVSKIIETYIQEWEKEKITAQFAHNQVLLLDTLKIIKRQESPETLPLFTAEELKEKIKDREILSLMQTFSANEASI